MSLENSIKVLSFIKRHKLKKNGEAPVFMRITYNDQRVEFGIKEGVNPKNWSSNQERIVGRSKNAQVIINLAAIYRNI